MASSTPILHLIMVTIAIFGLMDALPPCEAANSLSSPHSLSTGEALTLASYDLVMQHDCDLVLYDEGRRVWATDTSGRGHNCSLTLGNDGNLVIRNQNGSTVWQTGAHERATYVLVLQQDRNVVVYGPSQWTSKTNIKTHGDIAVPHDASASTSVNVAAAAEQVIVSSAA